MSARPLVSVCIANYNGIALLDACLQSVLRQDGGFAVEIIVHDDASTDGSAAFLRERHPSVRLIESEENVGFCVANNRMAKAARGEYLLLLNNDAELFPDALGTLVAEARCLGRPAILGLPQYDAASGEIIDRGCFLDPFFNPVPNLDPARQDVAMAIGACLWLPKGLWDELDGFPEWFGSLAEDMLLCCRARLAGHPVRVPAGSGYRHWVGRSFGGGRVTDGHLATTFRRRALSERNKSFVMAMVYPAPVLLLTLPLHLLLLALEGAALSAMKRSLEPWREIYFPVFTALWRERARLASWRARIQKGRRVGNGAFLSVFVPWPWKLTLLLRHGVPRLR